MHVEFVNKYNGHGRKYPLSFNMLSIIQCYIYKYEIIILSKLNINVSSAS